MAKKPLSKSRNTHKDNKKNKQKKTKKLKKINANQVDVATSSKQSKKRLPPSDPKLPLTALKNLQQQLKILSENREQEKTRWQDVEKEIKQIKKHLIELDNELLDTVSRDDSSEKLRKKLKQFKKNLTKKVAHFEKQARHLEHEISLFGDLEQRLLKRIETLEQDTAPWQKQLDYLGVSYDDLFDKINQFEAELRQFDAQLQAPERDLNAEIQGINDTLNQIQKQITLIQEQQQASEGFQQEQATRLNLLQTDTHNIHQSLQQVQTLQLAEKQRMDTELGILSPRLEAIETDLNTKATHLEQTLNTLNQKTVALEEELKQEISDHSALTLASALASTQKESQKQLVEQSEQIKQQTQQQFQQVEQQLNSIQEAQQQLIQPLEQQLAELDKELQSLRQAYAEQKQKQEQTQASQIDRVEFDQLITQVNQFDALLKQSREELDSHIQSLNTRLTDNEQSQSEHSAQLNIQLEQLAQQLHEVAEQSSQLQGLFADLQDQQQIEQQQNKTLDEQLQSQQQQLDKLDEQLQRFNPLREQQSVQSEQLDTLQSSIEQLQTEQASLHNSEQAVQKKLASLTSKLEHHYGDIDERLDQLHSHQLDQKTQLHKYHQFQYEQQNQQKELSGELDYLSSQIKSRSQLFGIGLISVLAISTLLFLNQDRLQSQSPDPLMVAQIKKEVKNETFSKINALTKQNSVILNDQLSQIRQSIKAIKTQQAQSAPPLPSPTSDTVKGNAAPEQSLADKQVLEARQKQQALLQSRLKELEAELKGEQQSIKESVTILSGKVDVIDNKVAKLETTLQQQASTSVPAAPTTATGQTHNRRQAIIPLSKVNTPFYGIQLSGSYHIQSIKDFMIKHQLINKTAIYQTQLDAKPWFIVILGEYKTFAEARRDMQQLSADLKQLKPWIRKLP